MATQNSKSGNGVRKSAPAKAQPPVDETDDLYDFDGEEPEGEEVDSGDVDEVVKLERGDAISGVYGGAKECRNVQSDSGVSYLHKLTGDDGVARGVWGTMQLDAMLKKVRPGQRVWIGYAGKQSLGDRQMHVWKVKLLPRVRQSHDGTDDIPF